MTKSEPVIGREIWPVFDYCEEHIEKSFDDALNGKLTVEKAVEMLPHMERMVELLDRALTENGTNGYPRPQLVTMKSTLISIINNFRAQL